MRATQWGRRRLHQLVAAWYLATVLGTGAMLVGPLLNDLAIARHPARALAVVTSVSRLRTTVEFQSPDGVVHSPPAGLKYPTGLGTGQKVWVEYQATNPDLVKVQGRTWLLAIIPAFSVFVAGTASAAVCWVLIRRWPARRKN